MTKFTRTQKLELQDLTRECIRQGFNDHESLDFIDKTFTKRHGMGISNSYFQQLKAKIRSEPNIRYWLNDFARVQFAVQMRENYEIMVSVMKDIYSEYREERARTPRDVRNLDIYRNQILAYNKRISELTLSHPFIAEIKATLDKRENDQGTDRGSAGTQSYHEDLVQSKF